ncbi:MAG: hypothetical protein KDA42_19635, partial [Planctomycetales bacterium]|nr:hypothetical protein [Planctomycetales bacterium]
MEVNTINQSPSSIRGSTLSTILELFGENQHAGGQAEEQQDHVRILVVVEGVNDIGFLRRISVILHASDSSLPNLAEWETGGALVFVPTGGPSEAWCHRLAPLDRPEFFLLDRELPPETEQRRAMVARINRRGGCHAALTKKRSLENYLHPTAIYAASGLTLQFSDFDSVAHLAAKHAFDAKSPDTAWGNLSAR